MTSMSGDDDADSDGASPFRSAVCYAVSLWRQPQTFPTLPRQSPSSVHNHLVRKSSWFGGSRGHDGGRYGHYVSVHLVKACPSVWRLLTQEGAMH